jgi:hypothetical protein
MISRAWSLFSIIVIGGLVVMAVIQKLMGQPLDAIFFILFALLLVHLETEWPA